MRSLKKKLGFLTTQTIFITLLAPLNVFADPVGNPWDAVNNGGNMASMNSGIKDVSISLFRIFQRIGIYGCIITTIGFLAYMALRWGDPRIQSETKSKIVQKFAIAFLISGASFILGLILQIVKGSAGYN